MSIMPYDMSNKTDNYKEREGREDRNLSRFAAALLSGRGLQML